MIGAEIRGVDLSPPLGNQTFQEIHEALLRHLVIFFRDQDIDLEQQKAFGRRFGKLHIHLSIGAGSSPLIGAQSRPLSSTV